MCCLISFHTTAFEQTTELLTHNIKPFSYQENGQIKGFAVDVVNAIQLKVGVSLPMKIYPFKRGLMRVQKTNNSALFIVARRPERENTVKWVGPLVSSNVYLYKNQNSSLKINTLADAKKVTRIAVGSGNADHVYLKNLGFDNLFPTNNQKQSLQMLYLSRIDLTPISEMVMGETLKEANINITEFERTNVMLYASTLYLAFSINTSDEEITTWQAALDTMKESGEYQIIYDKYIKTH